MEAKRKLFVVRHGETDLNEKDVLQGRIDCGLNATGVAQIQKLAKTSSFNSIKHIYSSPLKRATQSAEIIKQLSSLDLPIKTDKDLMVGERGLLTKEPNRFAKTQFYTSPILCHGESFRDVYNRTLMFLERISSDPSGDALVVTHGDVITTFRYYKDRMSTNNYGNWSDILDKFPPSDPRISQALNELKSEFGGISGEDNFLLSAFRDLSIDLSMMIGEQQIQKDKSAGKPALLISEKAKSKRFKRALEQAEATKQFASKQENFFLVRKYLDSVISNHPDIPSDRWDEIFQQYNPTDNGKVFELEI
ncbi:MAG: histidine phosphatase family protein [Firmicutes bacterium]|nr:histidine phosphatase family protein [Bacillota bacterium]